MPHERDAAAPCSVHSAPIRDIPLVLALATMRAVAALSACARAGSISAVAGRRAVGTARFGCGLTARAGAVQTRDGWTSPSARGCLTGRAAGGYAPVRALHGVAPELDNGHASNNVPDSIKAKVGSRLHLRRGHPLAQIKNTIQAYFEGGNCSLGAKFRTFDELHPVVTLKQNFDDLLTPADHVSRQPTDTFYVDDGRLLRCHMTAHQTELLRAGESAFLMIGDVYRRDAVDATHYPIFHQVDGVRVFADSELPPSARASRAAADAFVVADLKATLEGLTRELFGNVEMRWVEAYFPFTDPSLELEIHFAGKWLEVLGCGRIRDGILAQTGRGGQVGWAFGMGLERLAMVLYDIPDIRLFWSEDARFLDQFRGGGRVKFAPYSKYPACYKDVTFWLPPSYHENDFFALVREVAGDLAESVTLQDAFTHPKSGRTSHCYRINYRSMDRSLTNEEVDALQAEVRRRATQQLKGELR
jgi:phenylalanyl-tRNA synthetase alpha chain